MAYSDIDRLHADGTAETDVTAYHAVTAVRRHLRVLLLAAERDGDEAVAAHEDARGRPPARARGCDEGTL